MIKIIEENGINREINACDICNSDVIVRTKRLQVIQTTEHSDGRNCYPYLINYKLDICNDCEKKVL